MSSVEEEARLSAVRRFEILDTPPDGSFDRITALAARLFNVPISTISIVDQDRIWFKSHHGLDVNEIEREPGLCASAVLQHEPWVVTNAQIDPRTLSNPLVRGELGLRFYVGIPLHTTDGYNLGVFNIIDVEPREFGDEELETMTDLAAMVMRELDLRLSAQRLVNAIRERQRYGIELNDNVVQSLAVAKFALDLADLPRATKAVEGALATTKRITSGLLAEDELGVSTADLVRREPAAPLTEE